MTDVLSPVPLLYGLGQGRGRGRGGGDSRLGHWLLTSTKWAMSVCD